MMTLSINLIHETVTVFEMLLIVLHRKKESD